MKGKGHEKKYKYHQSEYSLIFYEILSINSLGKCMETSLENLCVDKGAHRVKLTFQSEQKVPAGPDCGSG